MYGLKKDTSVELFFNFAFRDEVNMKILNLKNELYIK